MGLVKEKGEHLVVILSTHTYYNFKNTITAVYLEQVIPYCDEMLSFKNLCSSLI